ncbi:MAG: hypothetical protein ABJF23_27465 [Bryobacteraceae bacterium]
MRTTIDLPDNLFRRTKAVAALRGSSMKELIVQAIERELTTNAGKPSHRSKFPVVHLKSGRELNLTGFDFDDLLP